MMRNQAISILIVDDSAAMRQMLKSILSSDPALKVVGVAVDPFDAREKIKALNPDVITLDIEMPRLDGLSFLEKLMRARPMPVLMISSLTQSGADSTVKALELGAFDFVAKPKVDVLRGIEAMGAEIIAKVKAAATSKVQRPIVKERPPVPLTSLQLSHRILAIGASTGGTEALKEVLMGLPADAPGTIVVQHMPQGFTKSFARRLDSLCAMAVKEAEDGDRVLPGQVLIAPGDLQTRLVRSGTEYRVNVYPGQPVNRHCPSVDVLFNSVAEHCGKDAVGVILTGMGNDGAEGMKQMHDRGAKTAAQDESTCIVFGMPREAIERGGVDSVIPLPQIAPWVLRNVCENAKAA